jgi:porin
MTAGAIYAPTKWLNGATLVCDSYGTATRSGFYEAFHSPQAVSLVQSLSFQIKPFGLPGTQRLYFAYSNRPRVNPQRLGPIGSWGRARGNPGRSVLRRNALRAALANAEQTDGWAVWYDFDQYVYVEPDDPTQGWGLFGRLGWSPGKTNPIDSFYSVGVGGKGVIPKRDQDRFGVGYYLVDMSDGLPGLLGANVEQGFELFYNIEVTPWMHITPDIQVIINPGGATGSGAREPAIVCGVRMQMTL